MTNNQTSANRVWDWPIRFVHWSFVILLALLWWTAENGEMDIHRYAGYAITSLLVFRLYWGFAGSNTARFTQFVQGPTQTWRYAKTLGQPHTAPQYGHNPLGAYSVVLLLSLMGIQVISGLFAIDVDGWEAGPLNDYVSFETGRLSAAWHEYTFNVILGWIILHLFAVTYYLFWRKQNLISAMLSGKTKEGGSGKFIAARPTHYFVGLALILITLWLLL
ncbi:cytochrome b/b6 domain-containing protein [Paraglaciecola sp.]|uniref:cytochrome b/b6 domain-containing protein n=1 Tax=Paraglaciecola sp. TaxID=1920173 RepID=UPI00273EF299|nr:cytochrome b/b6 domain-containing protein [Paraglaciecola sp.]MDP5029126.1 cytochrome b/b6 domain-containing protein [Paraglaciecola sp.]